MERELFLGFIKLHILYHATQGPIFGLELIRELESHGYQLSPGTLYPILHGLQRDGYLSAEAHVVNGKVRKYYRATPAGAAALAEATDRARALLQEISQDPTERS